MLFGWAAIVVGLAAGAVIAIFSDADFRLIRDEFLKAYREGRPD